MKHLFVWSIDYGNRMGKYMRTETGIILAESEEAAINAVWKKYGNDFAYNPCTYPIDMNDLNAGFPIICS